MENINKTNLVKWRSLTGIKACVEKKEQDIYDKWPGRLVVGPQLGTGN